MAASKNYERVKEYYSSIDFDLHHQQSTWIFDLCQNAKTDKEKRAASLQIYTTYLQFIEVFCLNVLVFASHDLGYLFINNKQLQKNLSHWFFSRDFLESLMNNLVFGIKEKENINDLENKKGMYKKFLQEAIGDYQRDHDLLNAYKHGFRVQGRGSVTLHLSPDSDPSKKFLLDSYDSSIRYFSRHGKEIMDNRIMFKWRRVFVKLNFLLSIIDNAKLILTNDGNLIELNTLMVEDMSSVNAQHGVFRVSSHYGTLEESSSLPPDAVAQKVMKDRI